MTVAIGTEPVFAVRLPRWQPPQADGVLAAVAAGSPVGWADLLLASVPDELLVWVETGGGVDAAACGMALLERGGVRGAVVVPARADARQADLALQVATYLGSAGGGQVWRPVATAVQRPVAPRGGVRIPHLVSVARGQRVYDTVVWEVASESVCQERLGVSAGELRDVRPVVEDRLEALLELRAGVRCGRVPVTAAGSRLAARLAGRPLTTGFVCRNPELVGAVLSAWDLSLL